LGHVARLDSGVPARDDLECAYALRRAGENHPDVQGRHGCTRLVMAPQPSSAKNWTLQSDVDIPGERDQCYGPLRAKRSEDNSLML